MRRFPRYVAAAVAAVGMVLYSMGACGEEWPLELKRLELSAPYPLRAVCPQSVYVRFPRPDLNQARVDLSGAPGRDPEAAFGRIVTTDRMKYECSHPFRGVVKFGGRRFAFAFDAVRVISTPKAHSPEFAREIEAAETVPAPGGGTAVRQRRNPCLGSDLRLRLRSCPRSWHSDCTAPGQTRPTTGRIVSGCVAS